MDREHEHLSWEALLLIASGLLEPDSLTPATSAERTAIEASIEDCLVCRRMAEQATRLASPPEEQAVEPRSRTRRTALLLRATGGIVGACGLLAIALGISSVGLNVSITQGGTPVGPVLLGTAIPGGPFELNSVFADLGTIAVSRNGRLRVHGARFHPGHQMRSTIELENGDVDLWLPGGGRAEIELVSHSGTAVLEWNDLADGEAEGLHLRIAELDQGSRPDLDDIVIQVVRGDIILRTTSEDGSRGISLTDGDRAHFVRDRSEQMIAQLVEEPAL